MFIAALVFLNRQGELGDFWSWVLDNLLLVVMLFLIECIFEMIAKAVVGAMWPRKPRRLY